MLKSIYEEFLFYRGLRSNRNMVSGITISKKYTFRRNVYNYILFYSKNIILG